ncbi:MAG: hypothetical protein HQK96_05830 [Nitrospirae bacterium]|nr:hypothetical protein [Nitrospirota bacterium]
MSNGVYQFTDIFIVKSASGTFESNYKKKMYSLKSYKTGLTISLIPRYLISCKKGGERDSHRNMLVLATFCLRNMRRFVVKTKEQPLAGQKKAVDGGYNEYCKN